MTENPADITTPALDGEQQPPPPAASNGHDPLHFAPPPPVPPRDPFASFDGELGLIHRELSEISAGVQATRLMMFAAFGVLALAVVLMARTAAAGGDG